MVIDTKYVTMVTGGSRVEDEVLAVDRVPPTKQIVVDASTGMGKSHVGDQGGYLWRRAGGERAASVCGQWVSRPRSSCPVTRPSASAARWIGGPVDREVVVPGASPGTV